MAFDQNGSTWQDLGDRLTRPLPWLSSSIINNAVNPIFIVLLAPMYVFRLSFSFHKTNFTYFSFANVLYPLLDRRFPGKFGLLQRMVLGMLLISVSFFMSAYLESVVDANCVVDGEICKSPTSLLWQIPIYFVSTCGEILFSISGLNFSYTEVGPRLKSTCAAIWLMYVAIGNVLVSLFIKFTSSTY
jgi:dipeptide/tripeptide permease